MPAVRDWSAPALAVLRERYLTQENGVFAEDADGMCRRVAEAVARAEARYVTGGPLHPDSVCERWADRFCALMTSKVFLPNSPTLMNAGKNSLGLAACYVVPVEDSIPGIFGAIRDSAIIMQSGGGVGISLSRLRPNGSRVARSQGEASGPVSFLHAFDAAVESIQQGGKRRGAAIGILRVDHPDILAFIGAKRSGGIRNFNLSVGITEDFMRALKANDSYILRDPRDGKRYHPIKARGVWDAICENAHATGDPGLFFLDRANQWACNPVPDSGPIEATNPCVAVDCLVASPEGWREAGDFKVGDGLLTVLGPRRVTKVERGKHQVYTVYLSDGGSIRATKGHQFHVRNSSFRFEPRRLEEIGVGAVLRLAPVEISRPEKTGPVHMPDALFGFLIGMALSRESFIIPDPERPFLVVPDDGEPTWHDHLCHVLQLGGAMALDVVKGSVLRKITPRSLKKNAAFLCASGGVVTGLREALGERLDEVPLAYQNGSTEFVIGLLDALFSLDGGVASMGNQVHLYFRTANWHLAQTVRLMLFTFGIHTRIVHQRDGHELRLVGENLRVFTERLRLSHPTKVTQLKDALLKWQLSHECWTTRITDIRLDCEMETVDLYEEETDTWITEGLVSRGCGEQPLYPYEACNLGSINVAAFTDGHTVDYGRLQEVVWSAVRFLDDVIDVNPYPLPEVEAAVLANRRIGLGIMGFADLLFKMKVPYASEDALCLARDVMQFVTDQAKMASESLAAERGAFPNWPRSIYADQKPLRHASVTTIAPTGSISIIADCSSGIEPLFALSYIHNNQHGRVLQIMNATAKEELARESFWTPELEAFILEHGSLRGFAGLPTWVYEVYATAHEIEPRWHVAMQAAFQSAITNSVSKTINLPNHATVGDVDAAFRQSYEADCLGITVFRDGCKSEQVLTRGAKSRANGVAKLAAAVPARHEKRPRKLKGATYRMEAPEGGAYITVNHDPDGDPREAFINVGKAGSTITALAEALGRTISFTLNIPSPMARRDRAEELAHQLENIGGRGAVGFGPNQVSSLPDAVAQALRADLAVTERERLDAATPAVIESGMLVSRPHGNCRHGDICPDCGHASLVRQEGCNKCYTCGYAAC